MLATIASIHYNSSVKDPEAATIVVHAHPLPSLPFSLIALLYNHSSLPRYICTVDIQQFVLCPIYSSFTSSALLDSLRVAKLNKIIQVMYIFHSLILYSVHKYNGNSNAPCPISIVFLTIGINFRGTGPHNIAHWEDTLTIFRGSSEIYNNLLFIYSFK